MLTLTLPIQTIHVLAGLTDQLSWFLCVSDPVTWSDETLPPYWPGAILLSVCNKKPSSPDGGYAVGVPFLQCTLQYFATCSESIARRFLYCRFATSKEVGLRGEVEFQRHSTFMSTAPEAPIVCTKIGQHHYWIRWHNCFLFYLYKITFNGHSSTVYKANLDGSVSFDSMLSGYRVVDLANFTMTWSQSGKAYNGKEEQPPKDVMSI